MNYEGEKFLLKLYRELYNKESVKHSGRISDDKYELLNKYLVRLEKTEKVFKSEKIELIKYLKKKYYDKYVIKEEDIDSTREDTKKKIINSQKESLDKWIDYLMKEETNYPMWVRYWTFQGMLQLGKYDKDNKKFTKRSKRTTLPFVDINHEALEKTMKEVMAFQKGCKIEDKDLEKLISNGSFGKIYAYNIANIVSNQNTNNTEDGIWKLYMYGEEAKISKALEDKNTGWCITSKTIAANYLEYGKIHIYYTKDKSGEYTIPRICIRQEDLDIAEIKGVLDSSNNLEYSMIDITEEKLNEFYDKEKFKTISEDIKYLTTIYNKHSKNEELTKEELRFLYEIDRIIGNFGWGKDHRIKEILKTRNSKADIAKIFNCNIEKIAVTKEELTNDNIFIYYGDIEYDKDMDCIIPPIVIGNIDLKGCLIAKGFEKLEIISGNINGSNLKTAENLSNLKVVAGSADFSNITFAKGLEKLTKVGRTLSLKNIKTLHGLNSLQETGSLYLNNSKYSEGASNLKKVRGNLDVSKMIDLSGFENLEVIEGNLMCYSSSSTNCLPNLKVKGNQYFYHIINIHNIKKRIRTI